MTQTAQEKGPQNRLLLALKWLFLLSPFLFGLYFPWASALVSLALVILLLRMLLTRGIALSRSPALLASSMLVLFLLLGVLWGCDRGMALVGAVQFLPLPLFVLALEQFAPAQREALLQPVPFVACGMAQLSLIMSRLVPDEGWFLVSGRLAGFFQYPNTFALYLLCALSILLFGGKVRFGKAPWAAVLVLGIALSGSRTVFVLLLLFLVFFLVAEQDRLRRQRLLFPVAVLAAGLVLMVLLTGNRSSVGRFRTISLSSSELLGRLLYARDAFPITLRHPFGLGYMGYSWLQGSFQTGVYSVQHVHNEFLQLLLDTGWIPAGLFVWLLVSFFRRSAGDFRRSVPAALICLHSLLDFDLQFVSLALLFLLLLDVAPKAETRVRCRPFVGLLLCVCAAISCWVGFASWKYWLKDPHSAVAVYPGYTVAQAELLPRASEAELDAFADRVLRLNPNVSVAWDAKALTAYERGEYDRALSFKEKAISLSRYRTSEYVDCFIILRRAYESAFQSGEREKAADYLARLEAVPLQMKAVQDGTSALGWKIRDLPSLELPPEYLRWLEEQQGWFVDSG